MKKINHLFVFMSVAILSFANISYPADSGSITISSPIEGAMLKSGMASKLEYTAHLSPDGNHLHVYVDDRSPIIDRNVNNCPCSIELPAMSPGNHTIVVKEARADHSLTGVQSKVIVNVK